MSDENNAFGKESKRCGTMEYHQYLIETDPEYKESRYKVEKFVQEYVKDSPEAALRTGVVRIPVVVHVVWNTSEQNISDVQIRSQIDVLNRDFRRSIANVDQTPTIYRPRVGDVRIEFQLAVRDPNCRPTNGITRR
jgi:hypothetical protein